MSELYLGSPLYNPINGQSLTDSQARIVDELYHAFKNFGRYRRGDGEIVNFTLKDFITKKDMQMLVPNVLQYITYESQQLALQILPALFQRIQVKSGVSSISISSLGEIEAALIPEGGEYPQSTFGGSATATIRIDVMKYGTKIMITEEALESAQFDILNVWLQNAGRALARLRERNAVARLCEMGVVVFDNHDPANSQMGSVIGRDITGAPNGSMTFDDLYEMYLFLNMRGFEPDTLLFHPFAWRMFLYDTTTREMMINGAHWRPVQGETAPGWDTVFKGLGIRTKGTGSLTGSKIGANPWDTGLNPLGSTFYTAPNVGPFGKMKVIVSPLIPFTKDGGSWVDSNDASHTCDTSWIIMADSNRAGAFIVADEVQRAEWRDPERDIRNLKLFERYGMGILEQGKGIAVARNINIVRNFTFENTNNVSLSPEDRTKPVPRGE